MVTSRNNADVEGESPACREIQERGGGDAVCIGDDG
jgi:hypothetical protein